MYDRIQGELEDLGLVDRKQREKYVAESPKEPKEHPLLGPMFSTKIQGELEHETEVQSNIVEHPLLGPLFQKEAEFEYEIVDKDERNLVRGIKEIPFRWICYLRLGFGELVGRGTGTLIGGHYVLTAGHCLFDHEHSLGAVTEIQVVPAKNELRAIRFSQDVAR
jgi:V8-like Glu-specific endopeptidase